MIYYQRQQKIDKRKDQNQQILGSIVQVVIIIIIIIIIIINLEIITLGILEGFKIKEDKSNLKGKEIIK
jgi:hypothetical protein